MRSVLALIRASWLEAISYRAQTIFSLVGLVVGAVPVYLVAQAIQPVMGNALANEGDQYFAFLVSGLIMFSFVRTSVNSLPGEVGTAISTGTLEALIGTPNRLPTLLAGLVGYQFIWAVVRSIVVVAMALFVGVQVYWSRLPEALAIVALVVLAYFSVGIFCAALVIAFRSAGPVGTVVVTASSMLGGVYYPTSVIPSWLQGVSHFLPMTYGLRGLRQTLLEPVVPVSSVLSDVARLGVMAVVMLGLSAIVFGWALRYARHAGSLSQY